MEKDHKEKMSHEEINSESSRLKKLVETLTTSGEKTLLEDQMKALKKICRKSDQAILEVFKLLMQQLQRKHCQIRFSAFQIMDELFKRSHQFRLKVVENFRLVISLTLDLDPIGDPMPPPRSAKEDLKRLALETVKKWNAEFGSSTAYKKLGLGYNYLKEVKKVDFNDMEARSALQREMEEEKKRKIDNVWRERVKRVKAEMEDTRNDIEDCLRQIDNCFELLIPNPELENPPIEDETEVVNVEEEEEFEPGGNLHGVVDPQMKIEIDLNRKEEIEINQENSAIVENLRDQVTILRNKLQPMVKKWTVILTKAGENCDSDTLKKSIDIKRLVVDEVEAKIETLNIDFTRLKKFKDGGEESDETDDDDFEEVPEKEGFEVKAEDTLLGIPFLPLPKVENKKKPLKEEFCDMTGVPGTSKDLKIESATLSPSKTNDPSSVPTRPMDWCKEEESPRKVLVDSEKLRFWGGYDDEITIPANTSKVIEFTGTFVPVSWTCRAPLASGKLCPRQDRYKCPFHGKIVGRDKMGQPSNVEDKMRLEEEEERKRNENPSWQDPELLKDLEAATGVNLQIGKKKDSKSGKTSRKRKYPGLIDIEKETNTVRKRLEKKVFNKRSLKRVAGTLNRIEGKLRQDKFGDQFNYLFQR